MKWACLHAGELLERRRSGLSAADGLALEEHLAGCTSCRADANLLQGLARLSAEMPVTLSETSRQRAIASALATSASNASARAQHRASVTPRNTWLLTAAAAAIVCAWFAARQHSSESPAPAAGIAQRERAGSDTREPAVQATPLAAARVDAGLDDRGPSELTADRVLAGRVEVAGSSLATGDALRDHSQLHTAEGASIALAHARVDLRADSDASWNARARKLSLPHGSALIEVDPTRHQSFEVETSSFIVEVLGTRFEVTQSSVHVLRGRVSVRPKAGPHQAAPLLLAAGSKRTQFDMPPSAATQHSHRAAQSSSEPALAQNASALLEQARAQLAARQLQQARRTLELAEPMLQDDASRAQALSLQAECEQQAHHFSRARDTYLRVVQRFARLPAAETALFAAARIEAEHGQAARAEQLFSQYLAGYPNGSFAREAELRLRQLKHAGSAEPAP